MLDGTPLNVFADGLGAIQVRVDGVAAGSVLRPGREPRPRRAGDQGGRDRLPARGRLHDRARPRLARGIDARPTSAAARARCTRVYTVGPNLRVTEDYTYTDGAPQVDVHYAITNVSARADLDPRRRARRPLRRQQRQRQRRDLATSRRASSAGATRPPGSSTACRRSRPGRRSRRATSSSSSTTSPADGLNNTVDSAAPDNGVGVELAARQPRARRDARDRRPLAAGRARAARHGLAAADRAPTATASSRHRRRAAAARGRQVGQHQRPQGQGLLHAAAGQAVHRAQGPGADPGRQHRSTRPRAAST